VAQPAAPARRKRSPVRYTTTRSSASDAARQFAAIWSLAKFLVVVGFMGYVALRTTKNPDVDRVLVTFRNGASPNLTRAIDALRSLAGSPPVPAASPAPPEANPSRDPDAPDASGNARRVYELRDGVTAPRAVSRTRVSYTTEAAAARIQGSVTLKCTVETNGTVSDVAVIRSLDPGLDAEAIKAVRQWRFAPGLRAGDPVPAYAYVAVTFRLPD